jgi:SAM-dependent methyltransferase
MSNKFEEKNLSYQAAASPLGGSYTDNKLRRLALPPLAGKRFLDLGCNTGVYCRLAMDQGASRVVGVDSDPVVIRKAREGSPHIEYRDTGWDDFPSGTFDIVIFLSAIHYAKDPAAVIANVRSNLATDGLLVLEGGLFDVEGVNTSDILFPSWRKVGDRCRHLTSGYLRNHLLQSFDWKVIGPSEPRGGDLVPRHVIHAVARTARQRAPYYSLDILEYIHAMQYSSQTIVESHPSFNYVRRSASLNELTEDAILTLLDAPADFRAFVDDIAFAVAGYQSIPLRLMPSISKSGLERIRHALVAKGVPILA